MFKKIVLIVLVALLVIQLVQPARNVSNGVSATDISRVYRIPNSVQSVLKTACYDCHSNNTRYPWYSRLQPGAWFMANHVKHGKADLNFSEFGTYSLRKQEHKLNSIAKQVEEGEMPVASYKLMHADARLTQKQKSLLINWATKTKDSLSAKNK